MTDNYFEIFSNHNSAESKFIILAERDELNSLSYLYSDMIDINHSKTTYSLVPSSVRENINDIVDIFHFYNKMILSKNKVTFFNENKDMMLSIMFSKNKYSGGMSTNDDIIVKQIEHVIANIKKEIYGAMYDNNQFGTQKLASLKPVFSVSPY
jgi:hypothetical protein